MTLLTSENFRSYKNDSRNAMFQEVLRDSGVSPERILHIGDSASDVLGAARCGIVSCWLNWNGREWDRAGQRPDYEVRHLNEVFSILGS